MGKGRFPVFPNGRMGKGSYDGGGADTADAFLMNFARHVFTPE